MLTLESDRLSALLMWSLSRLSVLLFVTPWTIHSPIGSSVHRISQERMLEWVAIFSCRGSSWPRDRTHVSCIGRSHLGSSRSTVGLAKRFVQIFPYGVTEKPKQNFLPTQYLTCVVWSKLLNCPLSQWSGDYNSTCLSVVMRNKWVKICSVSAWCAVGLIWKLAIWFFPFCYSVLLSHVWLFATPWTTARQASPSITNSQNPPKLMSIESVMPSSHLILCRPLLLPSIFPSIRVFSNESTLHWPKYWSFSFSIRPSNEHPGLISFRMDWLDLLVVQGTLESLLQHHSSKASVLRHSAFFTVQLVTSIHDHWKNHSLD